MKKEDIDKNKKEFRPHCVFSVVFTSLFAFLLIVTIVLNASSFLYYTVSSVLGGSQRVLKSGNPDDYIYYDCDFNNKRDVLNAANKLNEEICEEGFVLLKNEDKTLPFTSNPKVTVFGKNSVDLVLGGSGSNAGSSATSLVNLYDSLTNAGIEYNPVIKNYYESKKSGNGRPSVPTMGDIITGFPISEASLPYSNEVRNSYTDYNDYALVVISRIGGEGYDLPRSMKWDGSKYTNWSGTQKIPGARNADDHYLQLDQNETDMLNEACNNFDKVVVVINSASPLELGFLDDPSHYAYNSKIKSALWIGAPGASGINALGRVLTGQINPSGRTVDTYPRNFKNDPTWANFSNGLKENSNRYYQGGERNAWFVEYREGIYFGYKYYETRGFEEGEVWYKDNVVYPFGYGLSYTSFNFDVTNSNDSVLTADGKLSFEVNVKNIGTEYDGKDVIELYYSAPYTAGKIEKAHVNLGDFKKTKLIAKNNGTDKVTLELNVRDMASYDYSDANNNDFKGYELDEGEYKIYICDNAHNWQDPSVKSYTFTVPTGGFKYENDQTTGTKIDNLFDDVSNHIDEYLSRNNKFANYSCLLGAFSDEHRTVDKDFINSLTFKVTSKETDPWYSSETPIQQSKELSRNNTNVKLYDLIGKNYDDPLWDELLNQLTVAEMVKLISTGNFRTLQLENIDKPLTIDADGPMGFALFMGDNSVYDTCYYASETVLASTCNVDLAYKMGKMVGNEGLIGDEETSKMPYSGWYAPAMNLHRSQFGGRNFEYYSEDAYLSGKMASNVVKGAKEKGVYTYAKHFALNEQETKRDDTGLVTWANEQVMRESYFKPFEMTVKEGKTTAIMSSFNRIGVTWTGGSYSLLTSLLRDEWGFNGMVITDFNLKKYMDTDQMIRAGGDINLSGGKSPTSTSSSTDITCIRRATKNILYTVCNSCAMNGFGEGIVWTYTTPWWMICLIVATSFFFCVSVVLWTTYVLRRKRIINIKKENKDEKQFF